MSSETPPRRPTIVPATGDDTSFVRRLSHEVFARFGDYRRTLPRMMTWSGVTTVVATDGPVRVGFAMYGLDGPSGEAELLAIAVEPARHSRGVGRALLRFVEAHALASATGAAASVRLTVAEDNVAARGLFEGAGYVAIAGEHGNYDGGQPSIGLRKRLR